MDRRISNRHQNKYYKTTSFVLNNLKPIPYNGKSKLETDFDTCRNQLYGNLADKAAAYGWLLVAVTAARALLDSSFVEKCLKRISMP